jgi:sulfite exporter TauE/SafE
MGQGFILGLSTGAVCVVYCGPVLIPYLMSESGGLKKSYLLIAIFLAGRLAAYLLTALLAGLIGQAFIQQTETRSTLMGMAYMLLAALMVVYGLYRFKEICLGKTAKSISASDTTKNRFLIPLTGGFLTGINICPPFLLAITGAIDSGTIMGSMLFFLAFFAGTSVFFLPMPIAGMFKRQHILRIIGKFAAMLAGFLYFYKGLLLLIR